MDNFTENNADIQAGDANNSRAPKGSNMILMLMLIFAVAAVALYAYLRSEDKELNGLSIVKLFTPDAAEKEKDNAFDAIGEIPYDSNENSVFSIYKEYIVKAGADGIKFWDKKGSEVWNDTVPISKPILKTNGSELLAADMGGRDIAVLDGRNVKWRVKADSSIINADISQDGYVTVLSSAKSYGGEVTAYDTFGIEKYKAFISNNTPLVSRISPSGREMTVSCINTSGAKVQAFIKLYSLDSEESAGKLLEPLDCVYPLMWYAGDDAVYLAGDTAITMLDNSGTQKWTKKYEAVYSACMAGGQNLAAAVREKAGAAVKILGINGHELASAAFDTEVRNLSSCGNIISVNTVREVYFINDRGSTLGKYTSKADVTDVYFISRHEAAVITKNGVKVITIK